MAVYFDSIGISQFRGIKSLELKGLNHVNIIAGDNNSVKQVFWKQSLFLRIHWMYIMS